MSVENIFYLVFLSQVILLSYYYPTKVSERIAKVVANYPPAQYPKLYPESIEKTQRWQAVYKTTNHVILAIGILVIFLFAFYFDDIKPNENLALLFGFVQFIPLAMLEISGYKQLKLMRKVNNEKKRKAELNPRKLTHYISISMLFFAGLMAAICIAFVLYKNQFEFNEEVITIALALVFTNAMYLGIVFFNLHGKKLDPHQISKDRAKQISVIAKSLTMQSIVISIFLTSILMMEKFNLEQFDATAFSIYWQLLAILGIGSLLRSIKVDEIDFTVYRKDPSAKH